MDFFASQELARKNTRRLIVLYLLSIIGLIVGVYLLLVLVGFGATIHGQSRSGREFAPNNFIDWLRFDMLGYVALGISSIIGAGSVFKVASLRGGGESVASLLGGRRLQPNSNRVNERRILNVVEEMALAAGTPVPPVYVLDEEPGINAFAAGYTIDDAVIGLNQGTIDTLNRDELQGVVAHEFSHILNGDMRMSIRMIGILHGIQLIGLIGYFCLRSLGGRRRSSSSNDGKGQAVMAILGIGLIAVGWVGMLFARLIKASVSRQREFLADASAVQFTRNPESIAGALKMIGSQTSQMQGAAAEETSHMFFASMFGGGSSMMATHPPLLQRIQKIDPRFDGNYAEYAAQRNARQRRQEEADRKRREREEAHGLRFEGIGGNRMGGFLDTQFPIDPLLVVAGNGNPDEDDVEYSELVVDRIPDVLVEASRDVFDSRCIVFATLLNAETEIRRAQLHALATNEGQATIDRTIELMSSVDSLNPRFRLPVFEILQGTLTGMSPEQYDSFSKSIKFLVDADNRVDLFEFFLRQHLIVHLDRRYGRVSPPRVQYWALNPLQTEVCRLIAIVVRVGHDQQADIQKAWAQGLKSLDKPDWIEQQQCLTEPLSVKLLEEAIQKVNLAAPVIKKRLLTAMAEAIACDGKITVEEAETFRAVAESLDCPVPPVMASAD